MLRPPLLAPGRSRADPPLPLSPTRRAPSLLAPQVEHAGFQAVSNQRFGAGFVGRVANPSDILLFHRRAGRGPLKKAAAGAAAGARVPLAPVMPGEIAALRVEDLVLEQ